MAKVAFTFTAANVAAITAHWGSVDAWKAWVKQETFAEMAPAPPTTGYPAQFTERHTD